MQVTNIPTKKQYDQCSAAPLGATFQSCSLGDLSLATEETQRGRCRKAWEVLAPRLLGRWPYTDRPS